MIHHSQVIKIGGSCYIKLSPEIIRCFKIIPTDVIKFDVLDKIELLKKYKCSICNYAFVSDDEENVYCPNCGNEDKEEIELIEEENG
jgi:rubredoxin